jgi:hypothetical protein
MSGTPAAWEGTDLWLQDPGGSLPSGDEFENCIDHFDKVLDRWLKANGHRRGDCYYRGDFFGDRTQYLEIKKAEALNEPLLTHLQQLLREWDGWRVVIPTPGIPGDAIMIYPEVVRIWQEGSAPLADLLRHIGGQISKNRKS